MFKPVYAPTKSHCNNCSLNTAHEILYSTKTHDYQRFGDSDQLSHTDTYDLLQCKGCESIKLRVHTTDNMGHDFGDVSYPTEIFRKHPPWFWSFRFTSGNFVLSDLLKEVYSALQNDMPRLAAMGIRALLEQLMISLVGDKGTFNGNLEALTNEGYVSRIQKNRIRSILDVGDAAMHRGYAPQTDDIVVMVNLVEHLIESIHVHERQIESVTERVPKRPPRNGNDVTAVTPD